MHFQRKDYTCQLFCMECKLLVECSEETWNALPRHDDPPRWIPVAERMPEEGVFVAVVFGDHGMVGTVKRHPDGDLYVAEMTSRCFNTVDIDDITHWLPLPEPPRGGS